MWKAYSIIVYLIALLKDIERSPFLEEMTGGIFLPTLKVSLRLAPQSVHLYKWNLVLYTLVIVVKGKKRLHWK